LAVSNNTLRRFSTGVILVIAIAGISYFGFKAILNTDRKDQTNPFEYNIEDLRRIDPQLMHYNQVQQIEIDLQELYGVAVDLDGRIYVSGDESMICYQKNGSILFQVELGESAKCIATAADGDLFLGMNDHIEVYDNSGENKKEWNRINENAIVTSIAVAQEDVFVADAGNRIVWRYDLTGAIIGRIGEKDETREISGFVIPSPYFDVALDPDGFLWVVNPGRHTLENYAYDGRLRSFWSKPSMKIDGFCGCCNPTHISILSDGSFVTSEKGVERVKVHNQVGDLVSVVAGPDQFIEGTVGLDLAVDSNDNIYVLDPKNKAVRIFKRKAGESTP
jgi:hypothetical protein